jgi:hypothetical protein
MKPIKLILLAIFLMLFITKFDTNAIGLGHYEIGFVFLAFALAIIGFFLPDKKENPNKEVKNEFIK